MSQGFGIKSISGKKSSLPQLPLPEVAEIQDIQQSLLAHFADIKDPRVERTKKHQLTDIRADRNFRYHRRSARVGRHRELWH